MYLKSLLIENVGPIKHLAVDLPFANELPKPLIFVGSNGSGKSIVLSHIANFYLTAKSEFYDNAEIPKGKVFKMRTPIYISAGEHWSHAKLRFEHGVDYEEWQLNRSRKLFEEQLRFAPPYESWNEITETETNSYNVGYHNDPVKRQATESALNHNAILYFPPNRFEEPAWLNEDNLKFKSQVVVPKNMQGVTSRVMMAKEPLRDLADWCLGVVFDSRLYEEQRLNLLIHTPQGPVPSNCAIGYHGPNNLLLAAINDILKQIFKCDSETNLNLVIGNKHSRNVGVRFSKNGVVQREISNIFSLSTGETLLLSMFCTLLRDYDLTRQPMNSLADVRGVLVVDEIDLHLHVDLQKAVLPKLLKLFPKVQFIVTAHSPLFLLGMESEFGADGFETIDLPRGNRIGAERFEEFERAYDTFRSTKTFEDEFSTRIATITKPTVITEGRSDAIILRTAWEKLHPEIPIPFDVVPSGIHAEESKRTGGAKFLRLMLECVSPLSISIQKIVGLFDNDREGNEQFKGLKSESFDAYDPNETLRKHLLKDVWALLLPIPANRLRFASSTQLNERFLEIEHYFADSVLASRGVKGPNILDSSVFTIQGNKMDFANSLESLVPIDFSSFDQIFDKLQQIGLF